jgi:hypothetical protein
MILKQEDLPIVQKSERIAGTHTRPAFRRVNLPGREISLP